MRFRLFDRSRPLVPTIAALGLITLMAPTLESQQQVRRATAVSSDVSIKIWFPSGSLRLVGWDRDSLVVEGTVGAGGNFYFGGAGSAAKFGVEEPGSRPVQPSQLVAYVPRNGRVNVRSITGSIEVADLSGWFNTVGGDIRISGTAQEVSAEAMDGLVRVDVIAPYVRARTASGSLTVSGRVEDIAAATVSGPLTIDTRGIVQGRFETVTGSVILGSKLDRSASIDIDSHSGPVELQLASPLTGELDLTSVTGTITNGLDKRLPVASRKGKGQELKLVTGRDGASIVVRSFKGSIVLRRFR